MRLLKNLIFVAAFLAILAAAFYWMRSRTPAFNAIAEVGGVKITQKEYEERLAELGPSYRHYLATPAGKKQFLDILIREKLLLAAAADSDIPKSQEYKNEMERISKQLERRLAEYREYVLTKLWVERLQKEGRLGVSEEEIKSIANLAYLKINNNEIQQLRSDFSSILEYMDKLNEIDTSKISETSNLSKTENVDREDISKRFETKLLINAMPKQKNGYLEVKKVLYND